jgi:hypothetical protein
MRSPACELPQRRMIAKAAPLPPPQHATRAGPPRGDRPIGYAPHRDCRRGAPGTCLRRAAPPPFAPCYRPTNQHHMLDLTVSGDLHAHRVVALMQAQQASRQGSTCHRQRIAIRPRAKPVPSLSYCRNHRLRSRRSQCRSPHHRAADDATAEASDFGDVAVLIDHQTSALLIAADFRRPRLQVATTTLTLRPAAVVPRHGAPSGRQVLAPRRHFALSHCAPHASGRTSATFPPPRIRHRPQATKHCSRLTSRTPTQVTTRQRRSTTST